MKLIQDSKVQSIWVSNFPLANGVIFCSGSLNVEKSLQKRFQSSRCQIKRIVILPLKSFILFIGMLLIGMLMSYIYI